MKWIRLWVGETFQSTTFSELNIGERGIWYSLLIMAGMNIRHPGTVELRDGVPYSDISMSEMLNCGVSEWVSSREKLVNVGKIRIAPNGTIKIVNWSKYQTEYQKYRKDSRAKIGHSVGHSLGYESTTDTEGDVDNTSFPKQQKKSNGETKTPFKSIMLPAFSKEWSKSHEGVYPVNWGADAAAAKYLWGLCLAADPKDTAKYFEDHVKTIMASFPVDNFSALRSFWAFSLKKKPKKGLADV